MPIAHKYKCIFIHVPKCAGKSVEDKLRIKSALNVPSFYFLYGFHGNIQLQHLTPEQMLRLNYVKQDVFNSYFKFCFVRNPYDRAVSDYFWHRKFFEKGPEQMMVDSFRSYLYLAHSQLTRFPNKDNIWCHFFPQHWYVRDEKGHTIPDFVGRFENLKADFAFVAARIGLNDTDLPHIGKTEHEPYADYYNEECRMMVEDLYGEDIRYFEYEFGE